MSDVQLERTAGGIYRPAGGDERLWVKFSRKSRRNAFRSEQEGRPIYEPVDYVTIQQPGERDQLVTPVREEHKLRFPRQWAAYQQSVDQASPGTPVQILFPNEPHITDLLLDLHIQTVEQLAQLSEHGIERLGMDGRKYVQKAKAAMEKSESIKEVTRIQHELTEAQSEIAVLKANNEQLLRRLDALEAMSEAAGDPDRVSLANLSKRGRALEKERRARVAAEAQGAFDPPPVREQLVE